MCFQPDKLYPANDPELLSKLATAYQTLAHWRQAGKGPAYVKFGKRVLYKGLDLNAWLDRQTIQPTDAPMKKS